MLRLALKAIKHNPKRLILTSIAVMLGVSLVVAIHTFTNTIGSSFSAMLEEIYAGGDISIAETDSFNHEGASRNTFPEEVFDTVQEVEGVAKAGATVEYYGFILESDGDLPQQTGAPNLFYAWDDDVELSLMTIVEGRSPQASGEAVMDIGGMARYDYEVGDTLLVATDEGIAEFDLVGSTQFGSANRLMSATLVDLTLEDLQTLSHKEGQLTDISVYVAEGYDVETVLENLHAALPDNVEARSNEELLLEQQEGLASVMQMVDVFTLVFALIAVFVGAFIIANTFRIIVTQRTREIGLVRALGARGEQVRRQILLEALVIAIMASVAGIALGYLLALGLVAGIEASPNAMGLDTPTLPLDALVWGVVVGLGVTIVSALLPAIHASQISPMEALREAGTSQRKPLKLRNRIGGGLAAVGAVCVPIGLYTEVERPWLWVAVGAVLLIFGVTLLSAQILTWLSKGLKGALTKAFRIDGKLAAGNIQREPRRSGITASALMIGVLLLSFTATLTESAKVSIRDAFSTLIYSDAIVAGNLMGPPVDVPDKAVEIVQSIDGVDFTSLIGWGIAEVDDKEIMLGAVEAETIEDVYTYPTEPTMSHIDDGAFIGPRMQDLGYDVDDTITVVGQDATLDLVIVGTHTVDGDPDVFVDWPLGQQLDDEITTWMVMVNFEEDANVQETLVAIETSLEEFPLLEVLPPDVLAQEFTEFFDQMLLIITIMLSAALVIAILGVANTLFLSITERTRELGLLRAVGVSRRSVWRMITLESVIMSLFGTLLGIVLGTGLGVALVIALKSMGLGMVAIPVVWLVIYAVLAILAGIIAAIVPAWRASKIDILEAVTTE